jgi:hypothetical protein
MPILSSLSVLGAHFSSPSSGNWYDDSSLLHRTITRTGGVTQSDEDSGVIGASFDGTSGFLNADLQGGFVIDGAFYFGAFVNFSTFVGGGGGSYSHIICLDDYTNGLVVRPMYESGNALQIFIAGSNHVSPFQFSLNQTYYIAVSRDAGGVVSVYVNGVLIDTYTDGSTIPVMSHIVIGSNTWGGPELFGGKMYALQLARGATTDGSVPSALPTPTASTELLLNFGATAVPTV